MECGEGDLRVGLHRLRRRFAELLLEEVAQTVTNPADARAELRHLLTAWATASPEGTREALS
jgi:RNA polymerase sigma-70 factor (ECF subfamily)